MQQLIGKILGQYRLDRYLGGSAEGHVFEGVQVGLERKVAVRILDTQQQSEPRILTRFRQEYRATAQLSHTHILKIFDSGKAGELRYAVMELLQPGTLATRLQSVRPLPLADALQIGEELAQALQYVHERKLIHGNLVPNTIRFDTRGATILTGFGIHTSEIQSLMDQHYTHGYASPEVLLGYPAEPRSDFYQLGAVLYEAATGRLPYPGRPPFVEGGSNYESAIVAPRKLQPEITQDFEQLLLSCLRVDCKERPQDAAELQKKLARLRRRESVRSLSKEVNQSTIQEDISNVPTRALHTKDFQAKPPPKAPPSPTQEALQALTGGYSDLKQRETKIRLAFLLTPLVGAGLLIALWATGIFQTQTIRLIESTHFESDQSLQVKWRTDRDCFSFVEISLSPDETLTGPVLSPARTEFQQSIEGLKPSTKYSFRIALSDSSSGNPRTYSESTSFTTEAQLSIESPAVNTREARSAILSWKTSQNAACKIKFWTSGSARETLDLPLGENPRLHTIELTGLSPNSKYRYQISATSTRQASARMIQSEILEFQTRPALPSKNTMESKLQTTYERLQSKSLPALVKLEKSLGKFATASQRLDEEHRALLFLTPTQTDQAFTRRLKLAKQWRKQLSLKGASKLPKKFSNTLATLSETRDFAKLDQCFEWLGRAEGLAKP